MWKSLKSKKAFELISAIVLTVGIVTQFMIISERSVETHISFLASFKLSFLFMTIWTNVIVGITFWCLFFNLKNIFTHDYSINAILVYILIVGLVYHFVLSGYWNPHGKVMVTNTIFHYISPSLFTLYWVLFLKSKKLSYINSIIWLWFPVLYAIFTFTNGLMTKFYPYPIYNLQTMNTVSVARNVVLTLVAYVILGNLVILLNNLKPVNGVSFRRKFQNNEK